MGFTKRVAFNYNLRNCTVTLPNSNTKKYITDTAVYKTNQIWRTLSRRHKNMLTFDLVKYEIKNLAL